MLELLLLYLCLKYLITLIPEIATLDILQPYCCILLHIHCFIFRIPDTCVKVPRMHIFFSGAGIKMVNHCLPSVANCSEAEIPRVVKEIEDIHSRIISCQLEEGEVDECLKEQILKYQSHNCTFSCHKKRGQ